LSVSNGTRWFNCGPVKDVVKNELILHLDSFDINSYSSGTTWRDLTGTFGNINVQNLSTQWSFQTEPQTGKPCLFNSTNNAASTGISIPTARINKMSGTIELWIKPGDYTGGHGYFVNGSGDANTNVNGWLWFGIWDNGNRLYFRLSTSTTCCSDNSSLSSISTRWIISNIWHQVAVAWNVNAGFLRSTIFIDGRPVTTAGHLSNVENFHGQDTGQLFNGHSREDNEQFKGYCSEYRIYNRELSYDEVWNNFQARRERYGI
jgi:hypothetical protein